MGVKLQPRPAGAPRALREIRRVVVGATPLAAQVQGAPVGDRLAEEPPATTLRVALVVAVQTWEERAVWQAARVRAVQQAVAVA
jgi:hypothetical protein